MNSIFINHNYCTCFKKENVIGIQFHPERNGFRQENIWKKQNGKWQIREQIS